METDRNQEDEAVMEKDEINEAAVSPFLKFVLDILDSLRMRICRANYMLAKEFLLTFYVSILICHFNFISEINSSVINSAMVLTSFLLTRTERIRIRRCCGEELEN